MLQCKILVLILKYVSDFIFVYCKQKFSKLTEFEEARILYGHLSLGHLLSCRCDGIQPYEDYGPLHVLWQVSFGCWVRWSISSWQEYYQSVFFPKWMKRLIKFRIKPKKKFGTWKFGKIYILVNFIIQKFAGLKSKHFFQFFWWEVNLRGLRAFILQKIQTQVS